jgi:hypothetical protein
MTVHFASFIRPELDMDILPWWIKHYRDMNFDSYSIFFHHTGGENDPIRNDNAEKIAEASEMMDREKFKICAPVRGDFRIGRLRCTALEPWYKSLKPNDTAVIVDSDEFFDVSTGYFKEQCEDNEWIRGYTLDRWAGDENSASLVDAPPYRYSSCTALMELKKQYGMQGKVHEEVLKGLTPEQRTAFIEINRRKIFSCKAKYPLMLFGSHVIQGMSNSPCPEFNPPNIDNCDGDREYPFLLHFTWRKSIIERMCGKPYWSAAYIYIIKRFFGLDGTDDLQEKIEREDREYGEKGWVPWHRQ